MTTKLLVVDSKKRSQRACGNLAKLAVGLLRRDGGDGCREGRPPVGGAERRWGAAKPIKQ